MKQLFLLFCLAWSPGLLLAQADVDIETITEINLDQIAPQQIKRYWLEMIDDGMGQAICVPLLIARGDTTGPVVGITAAIHGNELNGIRVIQRVFDDLDMAKLKGTIIAIPGLNAVSVPLHQRKYVDGVDLNRIFPGKITGNRSQQYVWAINQKILTQIDYLLDLHTASFGRENSLYVRGDLSNERIAQMAYLQDADIILGSKGAPSTGNQSAATRTMRAEAMLRAIPSLTIEYGNPQVYQPALIDRGKTGIENILSWLAMIPQEIIPVAPAIVCKKSYWIYLSEGGYLEVEVELGQLLKKGDQIATLRNPFGDIIRQYDCPEDGVVIGRSSNPINQSGGRIIHLGIRNTD